MGRVVSSERLQLGQVGLMISSQLATIPFPF
jgi:hypothetical protein